MKYFLSAVSGIEVLLEFVLDVMETQEGSNEEWDEEEEDDDDEIMENEKIQHDNSQLQSKSSIAHLKHIITQFLHQNMPVFPKFLSTHAPGTENLVYLFYHLLL